jgi:hypothetical protein
MMPITRQEGNLTTMKYTFSKLIVAAACVAMLSAVAVTAHASNLVQDGNFSSTIFASPVDTSGTAAPLDSYGNPTYLENTDNWQVVGGAGNGDVTLYYTPANTPYTGPVITDTNSPYYGVSSDYVLELGSSITPQNGGIEQTIATTTGTEYDVTYYIKQNPSDGGGPAETVTGAVAGVATTPASTTVDAPTDWTKESFTFYATSDSTLLSFVGNSVYNESALIADISVTPVPEVSTMLGLFTLLGLGFVVLRKKQSFQPSNMAI